MKFSSFRLACVAGTCLTSIGLSGGAMAQSAVAPAAAADQSAPSSAANGSAANDGDIIVTAQKRSESVQRVPIAITVVDGAQLARQQITTLADLKRSVPGLEFSYPGATPGSAGYIRGIGTNVTGATAEASVGLVVDGVPQGNVPQSAIFDVARVEVLRGPQGTLFGQSVSAGLINITSAAPKIGEFSGSVQFELAGNNFAGSEYSRNIGRLILNVPLSSNAALRVSGHYDSIQDVKKNYFTGDSQDKKDRGARARLLWEPKSNVTVNLIADYNQVDTHNGAYLAIYKTTDANLVSLLASCGVTVGPSNADTCSPLTPYENIIQYGFSGQIDWQLGGDYTLTSITGYRRQTYKQLASIDGLPTSSLPNVPYPNITYGGPGGDDNLRLFTQEIRLTSPASGPFQYVLGGFFSRYTENRNYINNLFLPFLPNPILTNYVRTPVVKSLAAFGQGTYNLTDHLRLTAGGRYTRNDVLSRTQMIAGGTPGLYSAHSVVDDFSWKVAAQYDLAPRLMAYATVSRGFKGQTYDEDSNLSANPTYIKPEKPMAYEIGLKGRLFGGLNFDLNGYYQKVGDYQAQVCTPSLTRGIICVAQNIDKLVTKGFELGLFGQLLPGLTLNGGVAYTDARYPKGFLGTDGTDLGGYQITYAARWKVVASAEYEHPISPIAKVFVGADTVYRSRVRYITKATDAVTFQPHFITGARIGLRFMNDRYELALFARNLFGVREPILRFDSSQLSGIASPGSSTYTQWLTEASLRVVGLSGHVNF